MKEIYFKNFNYNCTNHKLDFIVEDESKNTHEIYFEMKDIEFYLSSRFITMLVGSICGKKYDYIYIDFPIPKFYSYFLENFTNAKIEVRETNEIIGRISKENKKYCLSFSGGFDSLAAYCLLKDKDFINVSMDFGGNFKREKLFFEKFNTNIITTNFLDTKLQKNHWTFMGIGLCIMSEIYNINHYIFGGIIQNSFINFTKNIQFKNQSIGMFPLSGMTALPIVQGLTEVGTIKIILKNFTRDEVIKSLFSLSNLGEFKLYRKYLLLCSVDFSFYDESIMQKVLPRHKLDITLLKNQGELFLLFFILGNYKGDKKAIENGFLGLNNEILKFVEDTNLDFYEKANKSVYEVLNSSEIINSLLDNNIKLYESYDYENFLKVTNYLDGFYKNIL